MGIKLGVCGLGTFGSAFLPLFQAHPDVEEVCVADLDPQRLNEVTYKHHIRRTFESLDDLCRSDVDAVALFTQRWLHGPQAVQALTAGKHVYSAVPAAVTLEELGQLIETVSKTGLVYMLGETSYYRPQTIYCRNRYAEGAFGKFVYGEGQYYHNMEHGFYQPFYGSNGPNWKQFASFPPMLYSTHSLSHILGVTFERMTSVSCLGFRDDHADGIFSEELSYWGNVFSNQTALFRTSDGGMVRINEFRRSGAGESRMTIIGTDAAYEEQTSQAVWTKDIRTSSYPHTGHFDYENAHRNIRLDVVDVSYLRDCTGVTIVPENLGHLPPQYLGRKHLGVSPIHPVERIPAEFVGLETGHAGSHQFLVVDFLQAITQGRVPPNNVWMAARYNAPGIVALESSRREGERLSIPDFGVPPVSSTFLYDAERPRSADGKAGSDQSSRASDGQV